MAEDDQIVRLTDKLSESINTLYKTGGFALAFGFAGIVIMLGARLFGQELSLWLLLIGALLTFSCFGFFLYTTIKGNVKATKALKDNKEAIDAVQDISIELTKLVNTIQSYSFKNIEKINETLKTAIPVLKSIPLVEDIIEKYRLGDESLISQVIVDNTTKIETIVKKVENSLINADHERLRTYSKELASAVASLREQLKK